MSGTSLDGLDFACCQFDLINGNYKYNIAVAETIAYTHEWKERLITAPRLPGDDLIRLHKAYGKFIAGSLLQFLESNQIDAGLIASHGHTIFHQPNEQFTFQLGDGASIAALTGIDTVSDFRSIDLALGGQGAPLVPIGDELLFREFDFCLNLGGFANISFSRMEQRIAYDLGPVNIVLNDLAGRIGEAYDESGEMGRSGQINAQLLNKLNALEFYKMMPPKSLGREWIEINIRPLLSDDSITIPDRLRTFYEHIACFISAAIKPNRKVLVSGGGAHNHFLMELIREKSRGEFIVPDKLLVDFKEALVFAFLGLLRTTGHINTLKTVTGAGINSIGGCVYKGNRSE
jgi:anhydro-N-acetylmuramic acid kinase